MLAELAKSQHAARDRALFILGLRAGFRITELLSLRVGDIIQNGNCVKFVTVEKRNMKKKRASRSVVLHPEAAAALILQINELIRQGMGGGATFIFQSRHGENKALSRKQAWAILKATYVKLGLTGKLGTHGMRKTFCKRIYAALKNDLIRTQELMGHTDINTTRKYLSFEQADLDEAVLKS